MTEIKKFDWGAISTPSGQAHKKPEKPDAPISRYYSPRRARQNSIPGTEELSRRISDALEALTKGVYWDRGSIVNIVL